MSASNIVRRVVLYPGCEKGVSVLCVRNYGGPGSSGLVLKSELIIECQILE